jgi:2-polyprenyl-6-methoxyphenol hydroxylase-like FAD-dependent oxidoreductase
MENFGAPELYEVFETATDVEPPNELRVILNNAMHFFWPLPGTHCRWSFQALPADPGEEPWAKERLAFRFADQALDPDTIERLQKRIRKHASWFQGKVREVDWSVVIQFQKRLVRRFGEGRCWLVGDAAHQTGPVGAQSMNIGIREAEDLASKLAQVVRDEQKLDLLQAYHQENHDYWEKLISNKATLKANPQATPWVKEHATRIVPCIPAARDDLPPLLDQVGLQF